MPRTFFVKKPYERERNMTKKVWFFYIDYLKKSKKARPGQIPKKPGPVNFQKSPARPARAAIFRPVPSPTVPSAIFSAATGNRWLRVGVGPNLVRVRNQVFLQKKNRKKFEFGSVLYRFGSVRGSRLDVRFGSSSVSGTSFESSSKKSCSDPALAASDEAQTRVDQNLINFKYKSTRNTPKKWLEFQIFDASYNCYHVWENTNFQNECHS